MVMVMMAVMSNLVRSCTGDAPGPGAAVYCRRHRPRQTVGREDVD